MDLRAMTGSYRGSGEASYHPKLLLGIIIYGYATGVFSSRKLERATYDSVAFRFIAANDHPDHDTIATFMGVVKATPANMASPMAFRRRTEVKK
jgi:transposase